MGAAVSDYLTSYTDIQYGFLDAELMIENFHELAAKGDFHQVSICLKKGLDPNGTRFPEDDDYEREDTALICAARGFHWNKGTKRHIKTLDVLLRFGARIDQHNILEQTPLYVACDGNLTNVAIWLVEHGADVNKASKAGVSPLLLACQHRNAQVVKVLLQHKAHVARPEPVYSWIHFPEAIQELLRAASCSNRPHSAAQALVGDRATAASIVAANANVVPILSIPPTTSPTAVSTTATTLPDPASQGAIGPLHDSPPKLAVDSKLLATFKARSRQMEPPVVRFEDVEQQVMVRHQEELHEHKQVIDALDEAHRQHQMANYHAHLGQIVQVNKQKRRQKRQETIFKSEMARIARRRLEQQQQGTSPSSAGGLSNCSFGSTLYVHALNAERATTAPARMACLDAGASSASIRRIQVLQQHHQRDEDNQDVGGDQATAHGDLTQETLTWVKSAERAGPRWKPLVLKTTARDSRSRVGSSQMSDREEDNGMGAQDRQLRETQLLLDQCQEIYDSIQHAMNRRLRLVHTAPDIQMYRQRAVTSHKNRTSSRPATVPF